MILMASVRSRKRPEKSPVAPPVARSCSIMCRSIVITLFKMILRELLLWFFAKYAGRCPPQSNIRSNTRIANCRVGLDECMSPIELLRLRKDRDAAIAAKRAVEDQLLRIDEI